MLPQVTFRGIDPSPKLVDQIWKRAQKLEEMAPQLEGCQVVIHAQSHGSQRRVSYRVVIHLTGGTSAESRTTRQAEAETLSVAMRGAFDAARRQLVARSRSERSPSTLTALGGLH